MSNWYKIQGQEMLFQLTNLEYKEDYKVWDNASKKFLWSEEFMPDNRKVADTKFMKLQDFTKAYPSMRKSTQYVREIAVEGSIYSFGFAKTANDQLIQAINNSRNLGIDALEVRYILRRTGQYKDTIWNIIVMDRVGKVVMPITTPLQPVLAPVMPQLMSNIPPTMTMAVKAPIGFKMPIRNIVPVIVLTETEKAILEVAEQYPEKLNEEMFVSNFIETLSHYYQIIGNVSRVKEIYRQFYVK